jgi:hypothetical protein
MNKVASGKGTLLDLEWEPVADGIYSINGQNGMIILTYGEIDEGHFTLRLEDKTEIIVCLTHLDKENNYLLEVMTASSS